MSINVIIVIFCTFFILDNYFITSIFLDNCLQNSKIHNLSSTQHALMRDMSALLISLFACTSNSKTIHWIKVILLHKVGSTHVLSPS